jgi:predicted AAA+ superfamily ATPase
LQRGAANGRFFENHVVTELMKNCAYSPDKVNLAYLRDSNAKEIDLLVERGGTIHPLEIKMSASPDGRAVRKFAALDGADVARGRGGIVCMCEEVVPIDADNCYIPCNVI